MLPNFRRSETVFAMSAVREAAGLAREVCSNLVHAVLTKEDRSPVTVADFAVQAVVGRLLAEALPDDVLVAEEDASTLRTSAGQPILATVTDFVSSVLPGATPETVCDWIDRGRGEPGRRFWTLDPIDGTKGFLRGGQYAVALALIEDGEVQIGVLGCPNLRGGAEPGPFLSGTLAVAVRRAGAWASPLDSNDFIPLRVSGCDDPRHARLLRSFEPGHTDTDRVTAVTALLGIHVPPLLMDSQAKYAALAAGEADLLFRLLSPQQPDYRECIWDQAAGALIVEEAGGRVTDLDGKRLDFSAGRTLARNRGVLASNGHLHAVALNAVRAICRVEAENTG